MNKFTQKQKESTSKELISNFRKQVDNMTDDQLLKLIKFEVTESGKLSTTLCTKLQSIYCEDGINSIKNN